MKKLSVLIILTMCFTLTSFAQLGFTSSDTDSVYVVKVTDVLGESSVLYANEYLRLDLKGKAIVVSPSFELNNLVVMVHGTKGCNENDKLIILLENGEKVTATSWNKFNCNGIAYFKLNKKALKLLKSTPVETIRVTNGRTHEAVTIDMPDNLTRYFIQVYASYDSGVYEEIKE